MNAKALKQLGYGIVVRGFLKRPQMSQSIAAQHELWKYFQQTIGNYKSLSKPWSVRAAVGGGWHGEEQQFGSVYMFVMKARQAGFLHSCDRHSIG